MGFVRGIIKTVVVAKVIEVVGRELSKPENQRKVKDGLGKLMKKR
jgi:hypothetical protein